MRPSAERVNTPDPRGGPTVALLDPTGSPDTRGPTVVLRRVIVTERLADHAVGPLSGYLADNSPAV